MYICNVETESGSKELLFHMNKLSYIKFSTEHADLESRIQKWEGRLNKAKKIIEANPGDNKAAQIAYRELDLGGFIDEIIEPLVRASFCKERQNSDGTVGCRPATAGETEDFVYSDEYAEFVYRCCTEEGFGQEFISQVYAQAKTMAENRGGANE